MLWLAHALYMAETHTQGEMFVNGQAIDDKHFLKISEYVQHEDVFVPTQTLLQALEYHANLRLGPSVSVGEKRRRIDALVHVRVGGGGKD